MEKGKTILIIASIAVPGLGLLYSAIKNKELKKKNNELTKQNIRLEVRNNLLEDQNSNLWKRLDEIESKK